MSHRQRDTHTLVVYEKVATDETDSLGDTEHTRRADFAVPAYVYEVERASAGGIEARDAGETPKAEKEASVTEPIGGDVREGAYVTITRRGKASSDSDPVYQVDRVIEDNSPRGATGPWRFILSRLAGTRVGDL